MKLRILSDLHLESAFFGYESHGEDIVLLAGDISSRVGLFQEFIKNIEVPWIAIPGNHEYYGKNIDHHENVLKKIGYSQNQIIKIDDVHFIVGTMWTNFELFGLTERGFVEKDCARGITDYQPSKYGIKKTGKHFDERVFTTLDTIELFNEFEKFLIYALKETMGKKRVVMTHFCPSEYSVAERFKASRITPYFASNMNHHMGWEGLWIHGHTHDSFDYFIGDTRVICNPKGYGRENENGFRSDLVVEI